VGDGVRADASPRSAVVWAVLREALAGRGGPAAVLDLGGGSGVFAVPLAELGHRVTVVDTSPDALATLQRRAAEAGVGDLVTAVAGDVEGLPAELTDGGYDLVLCHGLLEVVDDPGRTLGTVTAALGRGGHASLLVAGRAAAVLSRALGGHPADALRTYRDPAGRAGAADGLLRRFDAAELTGLAADAGLSVESVHGVRILADLVPGALVESGATAADALRELELALATVAPYRDIGTQLHVLARRS
jgi:S-adenosylmethionine-dependent methyltransferase